MNTDARLGQLERWLAQFDGLENARPEPASEDASFRRYFRVRNHESFIVMDAPPPEDCRKFVVVAGYLQKMGLNAPRILQADPEQGFLLITDLGTEPYLSVLDTRPELGDALYRDAIDALLTIQANGEEFQGALPPYDEQLLRFELSIFREWLCERHLGLELSVSERSMWHRTCDLLVANALEQPRVFVHRDFHSRNLMRVSERNPGILDFQDALEGPLTYDLVSLLKDCYVRWPTDVIRERVDWFLAGLPEPVEDEAVFMRHFDLMGAQRHLKAAGIFARLMHRDGKAGYLGDIPRTLGYVVEIAPDYPQLGPLASMIEEKVLPKLETAT